MCVLVVSSEALSCLSPCFIEHLVVGMSVDAMNITKVGVVSGRLGLTRLLDVPEFSAKLFKVVHGHNLRSSKSSCLSLELGRCSTRLSSLKGVENLMSRSVAIVTIRAN